MSHSKQIKAAKAIAAIVNHQMQFDACHPVATVLQHHYDGTPGIVVFTDCESGSFNELLGWGYFAAEELTSMIQRQVDYPDVRAEIAEIEKRYNVLLECETACLLAVLDN